MSVSGIKSLSRPDAWALEQRLKVDGRPFSLKGREYVIPVIRDTSKKMVVKKAAQTAFTILFLARTFHWIVVRKWHHLYLLPLKTGAVPFVQKRIDPMIDSNEWIKQQFKSVDNRTHKQTREDIALLIRGTNVESELQETPVDVVVFDEYDRMTLDWLEDAKHRTDGSKIKILTYLSTPSVPGHGVDSDDMFPSSDQHKWEVPCPRCGRFQWLNFDENMKIGDTAEDCILECQFCHKQTFDDDVRSLLNAEGRWTPYNLEGRFRGYQINQLNSPTMTVAEMMESYFEGQNDAKKLKSHYNQTRGEPYTAPGDQVTIELLNQCKDPAHHLGGIAPGPVFIGVDVGHDTLHVKASFLKGNRRIMWGWKLLRDKPGENGFTQLDKWLSELGSFVCVIDAHPDKREAAALSVKYSGRVFLGFEMDRPQTEQVAVFNKVIHGEPSKVIIDRTMAFDTVIHQMMNGLYILPQEAETIGEFMPRKHYNGFYHQMIQQVRVEEADTRGIVRASWKKNKNPDHWHHADMFEFIATLRNPRLRIPKGVGSALRKAGSPIHA